jgi:NAD(P)-dependent dehydrogenase (short-subunit alcohol dehydrogenase family)
VRLQGKTAIVTGGGRGIGKAIALALAAEGCVVAVAGRALDHLESTAGQIHGLGREGFAVACDVSQPASVESLFGEVDRKWDRLDILVNNAGQSHSEALHKLSFDTWRRVLEVNLTGTFLCSQAALKRMLPRKSGRIINIASTAALMGFRYAGAYVAAKHGVLGLTRSMALETAASGITVNAVCPGWVESDMLQEAIRTISAKTHCTPEEARNRLASENPQNRIIQPEEIAYVTVALASDDARGITGQAISVSGGQFMAG